MYCSETGSGESFRAADLKRISGGDKISARGAYAAEVKEFPARFTLFIATNFAPNMQGADNAMRRRIRLIDFPHDFENDPKYRAMRIKGLSQVLKAERSGIFNWLLEGRDGELKEGLVVPEVGAGRVEAPMSTRTIWSPSGLMSGARSGARRRRTIRRRKSCSRAIANGLRA